MKDSKFFKKIIGLLIVAVIFYFLFKVLFENLDGIKEYKFSFNYFYLILSIFILVFNIFFRGFIWSRIIKIFEPHSELNLLNLIRINTYANFGKYIPGKLWGAAGVVYFGNESGVSRKNLAISYVLQSLLGMVSGFFVAIVFLFFSFNEYFKILNLAALFIFLGVILIIFYPRIFYKIFNYILKKIRKEEVLYSELPTTSDLLRIFLYLFSARIMNGIAFFIFVCSLVSINLSTFIGVIGIFIIANTAGFVAFFAPGGVGVSEGILVLLLKKYLPYSVSTLVAVLSRLWLIAGEVFAFLLIRFVLKKRLKA